MDYPNGQHPMREIEIYGIPALYTTQRIAPEDVYPGMMRYELQAEDENPDGLRKVTQSAETGFLGTVLTAFPLELDEDGTCTLSRRDLYIDTKADFYTPAQFEEKYLSPHEDEQE